MNNDLISRSALKKAICIDEPISIDETWEQLYDAVVKAIDNAPTVDMNTELSVAYLKGRRKGQSDERPKGEWLEENSETGALGIKYTWFRCNQCGWENSLVIPKNFCPNCGAKMRGGAK